MSVKELVEYYKSPKDERLVAEINKIYRKGFQALMIGFVVCFYYETMRRQVVMIHGLSEHISFSVSEILLYIWFLVVMIACVVAAARKGFIDDGRFGEADRFPSRYYLSVCGATAIVFGLLTALLRTLAEIEMVGVGEVFWLENIATGFTLFLMVFPLLYIIFYFNFRAAKRNRQKMAERFED